MLRVGEKLLNSLLQEIRGALGEEKPLSEVLFDRELSSFGDSLLNFAYSLATTLSRGRPSGVRMPNSVLVEVAEVSGLRRLLPKRVTRKQRADAVESLLAYAWIRGMVNMEQLVNELKICVEKPSEALTPIVRGILEELADEN